MSQTTTSAPETCGSCPLCGYQLYVGLAHQCVTAPIHPEFQYAAYANHCAIELRDWLKTHPMLGVPWELVPLTWHSWKREHKP